MAAPFSHFPALLALDRLAGLATLRQGLLDGTLRLWNYHKGKCLRSYSGHKNQKFCCFADISVTGTPMVVCGSEDGKVYMWDLQSKSLLQTLEGHSDVVLGVACHPTADMIVTGGMDKDLRSIRVWELQAAAGAAAPAGA